MKFYKSFLFLLVINCLFAALVWLAFGLRFLIPAFAFLLALNLFLIFFSGFYFRKQTFSFFTPDDSYELSRTFEILKGVYDIKNIRLLKIKNPTEYSFYCFAEGNKYSIAISEKLLESFPKEDIRILLSYVLKMIQTGDLFLLSLFSGFLFLVERLFYYLNYPLSLLSKAPVKKENLFVVMFFKAFSVITRRIYKNLDKMVLSQEKEKENPHKMDSSQKEKQDIMLASQKEKQEKSDTMLTSQQEKQEKPDTMLTSQQEKQEKPDTMPASQKEKQEKQDTMPASQKEKQEKQDTMPASQQEKREKLALLLWKLHSLAKVRPAQTPLFLAPLFLINPLTDSGWDCYISLHPLIRDRLQALGVSYPP